MFEFIHTYWTYLTIPLASGVVGYATNWLAVKMMMSPMEFKGIGRIGWQGVIPANANKMARITVDHSVKRILTQEELLDRIEPAELVEAVNHRLEPFVEAIVDEVMLQTSQHKLPVSNFLWSASPVTVKKRVYQEVKNKLPDILIGLLDDLKPSLDTLIDMNEIIVDKLSNDKKMLVNVFKTAGAREFKFLERSGLYFGVPLGVPVMVLWYFYQAWWVLPLFGMLVGYLTNTIAIYLVQKPLEPTKIGPFTVQGLFLKRQKEVARYYGKLFASDLITAEIMFSELLAVEESVDRLRELIHREVNRALERSQGNFKPLTMMSIGRAEYSKISTIISDRAFEELKQPDKRSFSFIDSALDVENTIAERVGSLPGEEFYELLHPVIAEDEWKLVAVGAVLGAGAGVWQWALLT
tara:strand:- start:7525 stop:8754 length:1230 start_codon:yes stop_codon:yes gene_type:complete